MCDEPKLPDVLAPGLRIVFCSAAAGTVSPSPAAGWNWEKYKHWRRMLADAAND